MKRKVRKFLRTSAILAVLTVSGLAALYKFVLMAPVTQGHDFNLYLYPNTSVQEILSMIGEADSEARTFGFQCWLKLWKYDKNKKSGCYTVRSMASARSVAATINSGCQTPVNLTLRSVRKTGQIARDISRQIMADSAQIASILNDEAILDSLGYNQATVYCMIIPNTYQVYWNVSPRALVERLASEREIFWNSERREKAAAIGLDQLQVTTLASIIEEETAMADELPMVAGLYMNRLHKGMLLQADPTVIFALGERPKRVLKTHLQVDSPYNTYKHAGLPPAPIRFVNSRSIDAVLNYTQHQYIYMCAKEDFSGYHNFAASYSKHMENARRYQRALNQRGITK